MNTFSHSLFGCFLLITLPALQAHAEPSDIDDTCVLDPSTEKSQQQAVQRCTALAHQGDAQASYELGEFFYSDRTLSQDKTRALMWFEHAANLGHAQAQLRLGSMLFRGEGTTADLLQAYVVLKIGEINGSDAAMDKADQVSAQMDSQQMRQAQQALGRIFSNFMQSAQSEQAVPVSY